MTSTKATTRLAVFVAALVSVPRLALGGLIEFEDKAAWLAAVGSFQTVDFTEFPVNTFVTNHYANLGVLFTDGDDIISCCDDIVYPEDGAGLDGNGNITLFFDTPQAWIAADFAGRLVIELYSEAKLIYTTEIFAIGGGFGNFGGVKSTEHFDMAILMDVPAEFEAEIDNLYFGVPSPSALALLGFGALRCQRQRRRTASET